MGGRLNGTVSSSLARQLVLDELFDLSLYQRVRPLAGGELQKILDQLIPIETRHLAFWQDFFQVRVVTLDPLRRLKLAVIVGVCRIFGAPAIHLALEAIEVYGVRKYLTVWKSYRDGPLGAAVRGILEDEFKHEDMVVTGEGARRINPERVRNVFFGLNDGLVEILGAVSGFFAAFGNALAVLAAASTVAVAGALSMAAGAYVAVSSESEVRRTEAERRQFLGQATSEATPRESALAAAAVVGASYFAGALVPVLPVLFGARSVLPSILTAGTLVVAVSMILAFLSGMEVTRRVRINLVIMGLAVGVTYLIGLATRRIWGIAL
jgi:VIT1/CCC1 family predicted Fe2+/Mn2+ transporter